MAATTSNKDDLSPAHEHVIAGIVILFFGLLYCFFNCDWNSNSGSQYIPNSPQKVQTVDHSLPHSLPVKVMNTAMATTTVAASAAVASSVKTESATNSSVDTTNNTPKLATAPDVKAPEITSPENNEEKAVPAELPVDVDIVEQAPAVEQQAAPEKEKIAENMSSAALAPTVKNTDAEVVKAAEKEEKVAQAVEAQKDEMKQSESSSPIDYKLPNGKPVKIATEGFEGDLQRAFAKNELNKALIYDQIYFDSGSAKMKAASNHQLHVTAALMNTYPKASILLRGHTDNKGAPNKNIELSLMRANSMGLALGNLGIDTERIRILGMGDAFPISSNATEEGRKTNRRIEILLQ